MRFALLILVTMVTASAAWIFHGEMQRQRARVEVLQEAVEAASKATRPRALPVEPARPAGASSEDRAKAEARAAALAERIRALESDLVVERGRRAELDGFLEEVATALREERGRHNKEVWEARQFMPEGVRQALLAINQCLRHDGQDGLRFMRAMRIKDSVLHDVQLLDHDLQTLRSRIYIAAEATFHLDRSASRLTLTFKGGYSRTAEGRKEFPAEGERLVFPLVDGPLWEERLPYLVQSEGDYPSPAAVQPEKKMAAVARAGWRGRLNALLALSKTVTRYRIDRFRDLADGQFLDVVVLGHGEGKILTSSVEAGRLEVYVDEVGQTVELRMYSGTIRRGAGESEIPGTGYRVGLLGIKPARAVQVMEGMVVRK